MYKQPISTLTAIYAGTLFKSHRRILKHSIVLDRFIRQINTWKEQRKPTWSCFKYRINNENGEVDVRGIYPTYLIVEEVSKTIEIINSRDVSVYIYGIYIYGIYIPQKNKRNRLNY